MSADTPAYYEIAASPRLAAAIECFWVGQGAGGLHRVTPDGCADILFTGGQLQLVGPMTTWRDFRLERGQRLFGVRFRPGMWTSLAGAPADCLIDRMQPMHDLWGSRARSLTEQLAEAGSVAQAIQVMEAAIPVPAHYSPVEHALAWMERRHGAVSLDELAARAGLSPRQLRRVCVERTGLSPKFLARVLRFRRASERLAAPGNRPSGLAGLALDCGYYDQAHFIHEFREFSGRSPAGRAPVGPDGRFFQSAAAPLAVTSAP